MVGMPPRGYAAAAIGALTGSLPGVAVMAGIARELSHPLDFGTRIAYIIPFGFAAVAVLIGAPVGCTIAVKIRQQPHAVRTGLLALGLGVVVAALGQWVAYLDGQRFASAATVIEGGLGIIAVALCARFLSLRGAR
jgi:hypothetical protein